MFNTIRSINYTSRRNKAILITVFAMATLPLLVPQLFGAPLSAITAEIYFAKLMTEVATVWVFPIMILSAIVSSGDAGDKTLNYEIMAGRGRKTIFLARTVDGILWGALLPAFLLYLPLLYYGLLNGWVPEAMNIGDTLLRLLLSLLPMARMAAMIIMISVIFRSAGKGIGFGYLILKADMIIYEVVQSVAPNFVKDWMIGLYNLSWVLTLPNSRYYVINGENTEVFETALTSDLVLPTVIASLVMIALYLGLAYWHFTKKDRD